MFFIFFFHAFQLLAAIQKKKFKLVFHNKKIVKFILLQYLTPSLKFDTKKKKKKTNTPWENKLFKIWTLSSFKRDFYNKFKIMKK